MAVSLSNGQYTVKSGDAMERVVRQYLGAGATQQQVHDATVKVLATDNKTYANAKTIKAGDQFDFSVLGAPSDGSGASATDSGVGSGSGSGSGSGIGKGIGVETGGLGVNATQYNLKRKKTNYNSWDLGDVADPFNGIKGFDKTKITDKVSGKRYWPGY